MTFEEQLRVAMDALAERLREQASREIEQATAKLEAAAQRDRDDAVAKERRDSQRVATSAREDADKHTAAAVAAAERAAQERYAAMAAEADAAAQQRIAAAVAAADAAADARGRELPTPVGTQVQTQDTLATAVAAAERLVIAHRLIDNARSLTEVLDALVQCAGREAARVAVLLVAGDRLRMWRLAGFAPPIDRALELSMDAAGVAGDAVRQNEAVVAELIGAPSFAVPPPRRDSFAAPIALAGQVVGVLYADQGASVTRSTDHTELLNLYTYRLSGPAEASRPPSSDPQSNTWTSGLEAMARHASRCLEVITAFRAAHALAGGPNGQATAADSGERQEEVAARRYARLLIAEIRLYHGPAVSEGRRARDLGARLGGEIARARMMYEERVAPRIRARADYFQAELVRTLANGDASILELQT